VDSNPIAIGGNVDVKRAEQALALAEYDLNSALKDAQRQEQALRAKISSLQDQLRQTERLTAKTIDRFDAFEEQFQAGTSSLGEAAGLLETRKQSAESEVRLKYELLDAQRELAAMSGAFWFKNN